MKRRRVKITGIGPVTPAGIGKDEFWKGILEPVSRVRPYKKLGDEFGPLVAAYMGDFDIGNYLDRSLVPKGVGRHTLFAIAGILLALRDAGIAREQLRDVNCAVVVGASLMDFGGISNSTEAVYKRGARAAQARTIFTTSNTNIHDVVSQIMGITARTMTIQNSCCAGLDAIGFAAEMVAKGEVDIALCGGAEAPLHRCPILELRAAGLTPPTTELPERLSRPFDLWRTTGVVSEGACLFVIEPEDSPRRGYAYITGYAFANDGPEVLCEGLEEAARMAIAQAHIKTTDIDAISAWGPGHRLIDEAEARVLASLFGPALPEIPVVSIKGAIGSPLGAAPAIQVGAAALAQHFGMIPPTVNWKHPDPGCPLNLSRRPRAVEHAVTLINAHGVGRVNACLLLERC